MNGLNKNKNKNKNRNKNNIKINTLNTPYLVIVESPYKCDKVEKFLGFEYKCISSNGHIRSLKCVKTCNNIYNPEFEIPAEKLDHTKFMRNIIEQFDSDNIYLATDDDREGEGIAWHICKVFDLSVNTTKRIFFHEITKPSVCNSIKNPIKLRMNLVRAQQTRQILDRMIGFKISPILSRLLSHKSKNVLSAGRCQTPALRLIYDNNIKIIDHKYKLEYLVKATFLNSLNLQLSSKLNYESNECIDFLNASSCFSHVLSIKEIEVRSKLPPPPFNTSKLLQSASSELHISPKETMLYCQKLYQDGRITYMRTDSQAYSEDFLSQICVYIKEKYVLEKYIGDVIINENKNAPREAIRITNLNTEMNEINGDEKQKSLYNLIRRRTIESCMSPYVAEYHKVCISAPLTQEYTCEIEIGKFLGWKRFKILEKCFYKEQEKSVGMVSLIRNHKGKQVSYQNIKCEVTSSDISQHYSESGLIQKLEEIGIGRPSTYSLLVETIKERKYVLKRDIEGETIECKEYTVDKFNKGIVDSVYVTKTFGTEKDKLIIQNVGEVVVELLNAHFPSIFSYNFTKEMEDELDNVVNDIDKDENEVCLKCDLEIKKCKLNLENKLNMEYNINEDCVLVFGKSRCYIRFRDQSTRSIRDDVQIDFAKLEMQEYTLEELVENEMLGIYEDEPIYINTGKFGPYVKWGENRESLNMLISKKAVSELRIEDIISYLELKKQKRGCANPNILRSINDSLSVRRGRSGPYIWYCPEKCLKPQFISLKAFRLGYMTCPDSDIIEWLKKYR